MKPFSGSQQYDVVRASAVARNLEPLNISLVVKMPNSVVIIRSTSRSATMKQRHLPPLERSRYSFRVVVLGRFGARRFPSATSNESDSPVPKEHGH